MPILLWPSEAHPDEGRALALAVFTAIAVGAVIGWENVATVPGE